MLLGTLLLAFAVHPVATPAPATAAPEGLSWAEAEALRVKVLELERRGRLPSRGKTNTPAHPAMTVTEGELNSYINLLLAPRFPAGLIDPRFALRGGSIELAARVDLDRVKAKAGTSAWSPLALLSGQVPLEIRGRLKNDARFGTFELEEIRLGPMMIPPALLQQLVLGATRTKRHPQGYDILAPFRLPYALRRVRVQMGRAQLEW
jgi:hypothetical protein